MKLIIANKTNAKAKTFNLEVEYMFITPEMMVEEVIPTLIKNGDLPNYSKDTHIWIYLRDGAVEFDSNDEAIN